MAIHAYSPDDFAGCDKQAEIHALLIGAANGQLDMATTQHRATKLGYAVANHWRHRLHDRVYSIFKQHKAATNGTQT